MATATHVAQGKSSSNAYATPSQSAGSGKRILTVSSAVTGGSVSGHTATGGGVTWTEEVGVEYGTRRRLSIFVSSGPPTAGAITITASISGGSTFVESIWVLTEANSYNAASFFGGDKLTANGNSGTSVNLADLGTIDAGDLVFFAVGFEDAADSLAVAAGSTQLAKEAGGTDVRSVMTGYSTTDDTPGATWTTAGKNYAIAGFIINTGTDGEAGGGGEEESDAHFTEQETFSADATVIVSSVAAFTEQELLPEPPDTYLIVDSPAAFEEQELFEASAPNEVDPVDFEEQEEFAADSFVRVFSAADFAQDETVAGDAGVTVHGDAGFTEDEGLSADAGATVFASVDFQENELLDVDAGLAGVTPVESEATFAERETFAATAEIRVFSLAAFVQDERFAVAEDEPPTDALRMDTAEATPAIRLTVKARPALRL